MITQLLMEHPTLQILFGLFNLMVLIQYLCDNSLDLIGHGVIEISNHYS